MTSVRTYLDIILHKLVENLETKAVNSMVNCGQTPMQAIRAYGLGYAYSTTEYRRLKQRASMLTFVFLRTEMPMFCFAIFVFNLYYSQPAANKKTRKQISRSRSQKKLAKKEKGRQKLTSPAVKVHLYLLCCCCCCCFFVDQTCLYDIAMFQAARKNKFAKKNRSIYPVQVLFFIGHFFWGTNVSLCRSKS